MIIHSPPPPQDPARLLAVATWTPVAARYLRRTFREGGKVRGDQRDQDA